MKRTYKKWLKVETAFLKENYLRMTNKDMALQLNRKRSSIACKLQRLDLFRIKRWTEKEIRVLIKKYPNTTNKEMVKYLNTPFGSVFFKAQQLGLRKSDKHIRKIRTMNATFVKNRVRSKPMSRDERKKHQIIRNEIENLKKLGYTDEKISSILEIPIGNNPLKDKKTIKWYNFCLRSRKVAKDTHKKHPNLYVNNRLKMMEGLSRKRKDPEYDRKYREQHRRTALDNYQRNPSLKAMCAATGRRTIRKAIETMKKNGTYTKHQVEAGSIGGKKGIKSTIQILKKDGKYIKHQRKAAKIGGAKASQLNRENKPYWFMGVPFDSNQELEFCKMLLKYKIIKKPVEGTNTHFKTGSKDIDFFPQQKLFIEFHPWDRKFNKQQYYDRRRKALDENGFEKIPLTVIERLDEFEDKVLTFFGGSKN